MCGRFVAATPVAELAERFLATQVEVGDDPGARYNVAPTDEVVVVAPARDGRRTIASLRWGLVPSWARVATGGPPMINLRAETVSQKPAFRRTLARRRCIIPADGFYEWKDMGGGRRKQPYFVRSRGGEPLALAGLWDVWKDPEDQDAEWLRSCAIVTTEPNELVAPLHDRMPCVLAEEHWDTWLDPGVADADLLASFLRPYPAERMVAWPVGTEVNSVRNDGAHLVDPAPPADPPAAPPADPPSFWST